MKSFIDFWRRQLIPVGYPTVIEEWGFYISLAVGILFTVLYSYQFFYILVALLKKPLSYPETDRTRRYAAVIAARNEERVLPMLLSSLRAQTYPQDRLTVFVVADNCTDQTAAAARQAGAVTFERHDKREIGKGYALRYLFDRIAENEGLRAYDAYLVFDADNVLSPDYIAEMDKAYCAGNRILTSYRNSKNYGTNWISAGYALWFLRESRHLNNPRSLLHTSAAISGTGFLVDSDIIAKNGGWRHFLLTEDIEFTADAILHGERVGYCHRAELFDEQPETFRQSWQQRKRWAKGFFQVFRYYGGGLCRGALRLYWACFDMTLNIMPAFLLSVIQLFSLLGLFIANFAVYHEVSATIPGCFVAFFLYGYLLLLWVGAVALFTEWRHVHCNKRRALLLLFTFPVFMMTYIPISVSALFSRVEWKPIEHKHAKGVEEIAAEGCDRDRPR